MQSLTQHVFDVFDGTATFGPEQRHPKVLVQQVVQSRSGEVGFSA
jgi:hypothetical protein